jgi:hypothetical protein
MCDMIDTIQKPMEEIPGAPEAFERIGVIGCDGSAKACATGGTAQLEIMVRDLKGHGKDVEYLTSYRREPAVSGKRSRTTGAQRPKYQEQD